MYGALLARLFWRVGCFNIGVSCPFLFSMDGSCLLRSSTCQANAVLASLHHERELCM